MPQQPTLEEFKECCGEADRLRDIICEKLIRQVYKDTGDLESKISSSAKKLKKVRKDAKYM